MQALHFCFALGTVFGPLMSQPFLSHDAKSGTDGTPTSATTTEPSLSTTTVSPTMTGTETEQPTNATSLEWTTTEASWTTTDSDWTTFSPASNATQTGEDSQILVPYTITAVLFVACAVAYVGMMVIFRKSIKQMRSEANNNQKDGDKEDLIEIGSDDARNYEALTAVPGFLKYLILVLAFGSATLAFEGGLEINQASYLETFITKLPLDIKDKKSEGAYLSAVLNGSFTVSRFLSIFLAMKLSPRTMIIMNLVVINVGTTLVSIFARTASVTGLYLGYVVLGFGFSSTFPAVFSFVEQRIRMSETTTSVFFFVTMIYSSVAPFVQGNSIDNNPMIFANLNQTSGIVCLVLFVGLCLTDIPRKKLENKLKVRS